MRTNYRRYETAGSALVQALVPRERRRNLRDVCPKITPHLSPFHPRHSDHASAVPSATCRRGNKTQIQKPTFLLLLQVTQLVDLYIMSEKTFTDIAQTRKVALISRTFKSGFRVKTPVFQSYSERFKPKVKRSHPASNIHQSCTDDPHRTSSIAPNRHSLVTFGQLRSPLVTIGNHW
jgi:hypothetical protein